ncbi:MAG: nitronate monooxygenase [Gammaproteobacteria bacterium]|nr:nitronate monooxygenase [Gammaproteobacteria bacterium]
MTFKRMSSLSSNTFKKRLTDFDHLFSSTGVTPPRYNIGLAPMYGVSTPSLVSAVLHGGGFAFHGLGDLSAEKAEAEITAIYKKTDKQAPLGINLFSYATSPFTREQVKRTQNYSKPYWELFSLEPPDYNYAPENRLQEQIKVILDLNVKIVSCTFGLLPTDLLTQLKKSKVVVGATINNPHEALLAQKNGYDFIVAQSGGAGGHLGGFSENHALITDSNALFKNCRALLGEEMPIFAAGSIRYGYDYLSAIMNGANAVLMGTQFIITDESEAEPEYKIALMGKLSDIDPFNTLLNPNITGKYVRGLPTKLFTESLQWQNVLGYPHMNMYLRELRKKRDNAFSTATWWSGQAVVRNELTLASEIPKIIYEEAIQALRLGDEWADILGGRLSTAGNYAKHRV